MEAETVRILQGKAGAAGEYLRYLKDPKSGRYGVPRWVDEQVREQPHAALIAFVKVSNRGLKTDKEIEAAAEALRLKMEGEESKVYAAIIDTGLMHKHPLLRGHIVESVDFTGEGPEDLNGHGSMCALLFQAASISKPRYLNVKVADARGVGTAEALVAGLDWLVEFKRQHPDSPFVANLSLGVYSKGPLGIGDCRGECKVCKAAIRAAESDITLAVAAGNEAGRTSCPAKAAWKCSGIMAVAALDFDQSGIGNIGVRGGTVEFVPM